MRDKVLKGIALGTLGTFSVGLAGHYLTLKVDPHYYGDVPESFAVLSSTASDTGVIVQDTISGEEIKLPPPRPVKIINGI